MKKYLIFILLLSAVVTSYGQDKDIRFNVFVDPQITWMSPDAKDVDKDGSKFGVNVGLGLDKFFAKNYALTTGISLSTAGGKLQFDNKEFLKVHGDLDSISGGSTLEYKLQYINIPLGLKLKTNEIGYFTYFAHLGIDAGVNIKATGTSSTSADDFENENISDEIKLFRVGYFIGGGIEYSIGGNSALLLGITYSNGFTDITSDSSNKATLGTVALRIGVQF